jgi:AcrR family transcriptional regulator
MTNGDQEHFDGRVIPATMDLAAQSGWERCQLSAIAEATGIEAADLIRRYGDKIGVLRTLAAHIDAEVLATIEQDDQQDVPIREQLLEVLMVRFDAMAPYKIGITSIARSVIRNPGRNPGMISRGAMALGGSMREALRGVGVSTAGPLGVLRAKALALVFLDALTVWFDDDNPDLSATMRRLDERLKLAESIALSFASMTPATAKQASRE